MSSQHVTPCHSRAGVNALNLTCYGMLLLALLPILFLLPLLIIELQLLREARRLHATRGLYEQLAAMQMRHHHYDRAE